MEILTSTSGSVFAKIKDAARGFATLAGWMLGKKVIVLFAAFIYFTLGFSQRLPELIPYRKGHLWGFSDSTGKIIIEPKWDHVSFFSEGAAQVFIGDKFGVINKKGKLIAPVEYSNLPGANTLKLFNGWIQSGLFPVSINGKFGAMNSRGKIKIPLEFDWLKLMSGNVMVYMKGNHTGLLDSKGKILCAHQDVMIDDSKNGFCLTTRQVSPPDTLSERSGIFNYGLLNNQGKELLKPDFDAIYITSFGIAEIRSAEIHSLIDTTGRIFNPCEGKDWNVIGPDMIALRRDSGIVIVNFKGDILKETSFLRVDPFCGELALVMDRNWLWGFMDKTLQLVIPCSLYSAGYFNNGVALAVKDDVNQFKRGGWNAIDEKGRFLFAPGEYEWGEDFENGVAKVRKGGKYGVVDNQGRILVSPVYNSPPVFQDHRAIVPSLSFHHLLIDEEGNEIYEAKTGFAINATLPGTSLFYLSDKRGELIGFVDAKGREYFE